MQGGIAYPNVQYQYYSQYKLADGSWSTDAILQDWSTSASCTWTPTTAENYTVTVNARPVGDTAPYAATTSISDNVLPANLTGVTLAVHPSSPQYAGTTLTFTATVQGGIVSPNVQYQFVAQYKNTDGSWAPNLLLQDWSTSSSCTWTPLTAQYFYVNVYARPVGDTAPYAATTYLAYNVLPPTLTGVTLSASPPSPRATGTAITLTATPVGGMTAPNVQYQFYAQYKLANGSWSSNILISDWSTSSSCSWTPTSAENYYVNVNARPVGDMAPYAQTNYLAYTILPANLTGVTLSASPASPRYAGTPLTFTAAVQGGIVYPNVQYQFVAQYKNTDGSWAPNILLQDWSTSSSCSWTPTTAQYYYVNVYTRPVGNTAPYAAETYLAYNVLPTDLTGVTLAASPSAPQYTGKAITLTATVQGGIVYPNVQYQFVAQYKLTNGSWAPNILISDWSTTNQCTWTPTTAENYDVNVYARPVGDMAPYAQTTYITYSILPANLTGVTLSASLPAPQTTGTPITLSATVQGGIASRTCSTSSSPSISWRAAPGQRISSSRTGAPRRAACGPRRAPSSTPCMSMRVQWAIARPMPRKPISSTTSSRRT